MILSCNNCGAKFNVKDEDIGPDGRDVRCSVCAYEWFQSSNLEPKKSKTKAAKEDSDLKIDDSLEKTLASQATSSNESELAVTPEPTIKPGLRTEPSNSDVQPLHKKVWLLYTLKYTSALCLVLLIFVLTITYRTQIIKRFPASSVFFEAISLSDISNLKFDFVDCTLIKDESENADPNEVKLSVKVIAKNTGIDSQFLDAIRFFFYTKDKTLIGNYNMNLAKKIEGGKEEVIEGKLNHMPKEVTFVIIEMGNYFNLAFSRQSAILNYNEATDKDKTE